MSESIKAVKEMGKKFFTGLSYVALYPFVIPTFTRKWMEKCNDDIPIDTAIPIGGIDLTIAGICLMHGIMEKNSYTLAFGAANLSTNLASCLYEWFRYTKQNMQSSQPQSKPNELEKKVEEVKEEPVVKTKPAKTFVNPFEVDLEE